MLLENARESTIMSERPKFIRPLLDERKLLLERIKAIEVLLSQYGVSVDSASETDSEKETARLMPRRVHLRRSGSTTDEILDVVRELLAKADTPVKPSTLVTQLSDGGVKVGGTRPLATLSAMLSNSDEFISMPRRQGWILASRETEFRNADPDLFEEEDV